MSYDRLANYLEARLRVAAYGCESGVDDNVVRPAGVAVPRAIPVAKHGAVAASVAPGISAEIQDGFVPRFQSDKRE